MPRLVGLSAPKALEQLRRVGLSGATRGVFSKKPRDQVVEQSPRPGGELAKSGTVIVYVSKGPKPAPVPDVTGQAVADALGTLRAQGFRTRIVGVPNPEPAGHVVAQHPKADTRAPTSELVRLNVSDGSQPVKGSRQPVKKPKAGPPAAIASPTPTAAPTEASSATHESSVRVPNVEGEKLSHARKLLRRAGLILEIRHVPSSQPPGTIVAQAKEPGTAVRPGTHVLVTVSTGNQSTPSSAPSQSGSQPIPVPDVTGEDEQSATEDLQNAGLEVRSVDENTTDASQDGLVIDETPTANTPVQPNSTVTIFIAHYTG